jgi:hypothetical protein
VSKFTDNLNARREALGLDVKEVAAELNRRGVHAAYPTVAGWFNGSRGERWKVDELRALLDVLQTDLKAITEGDVAMVEGPMRVAIAQETAALTDQQQELVLALVRSMKPGG